MGTVPTPHTWIAGEDATSALMQSLTDTGLYNSGSTTSDGSRRPVFQGRQTTAQSLASGTPTAIQMDTEDVDYDAGHSTVTTPARYIARTAGWHAISGGVGFTASTTGRRIAQWQINSALVPGGEIDIPAPATSTIVVVPARSMLVYLNVGDYLELFGQQDSGGALNTAVSGGLQSTMTVEWRSN